MKLIREQIAKNKITIIGIFVGALCGFFYNRFVGCSNGTCVILASSFNTTIYGAIMGGLLFSIFNKK